MYELKEALTYRPFDVSVNPDSDTWKTYGAAIRDNDFKLKEVVFDLSDAVVQGTSESKQYTDEVLSRF